MIHKNQYLITGLAVLSFALFTHTTGDTIAGNYDRERWQEYSGWPVQNKLK